MLNLQGVRADFRIEDTQVPQSAKRETAEFHLPEPADNFKRMFAYLMKTRHLSYEVVSYFVKKKLLYEEKGHHNCVFVGGIRMESQDMQPAGELRQGCGLWET